jgi:ABC-type nitrate/sulfonate/bicarbonate transport system substrate-binding protein
VWAARRDVYERDSAAIGACMHALTDAYTWSRSHRDQVVALAQRAISRPAGFYEAYYGKLNFMFHVAAQNGLAEFCRQLVDIGAIATLPSALAEPAGAFTR